MRCSSVLVPVVLSAALAAGCGKHTVSQVTGATVSKCQSALVGVPATVPASGANFTASVSTTRDCTWSVTSDGGWVQFTPNSGQGEGAVSVVVAPNTAYSARSATIQLNDATLRLAQDAAPAPPPPPRPAPSPTPTPTPAPGPPPAPSIVSFTGQVSGRSGSCPSLSFTAAGYHVLTSSQIVYTKGNCGDVKNGAQLSITGQLSSGTVQAAAIQFKK